MSKINKAAVLNPFNELTANILNYIPRATTSEFGIVAIGSGINVDELGRIYLDTQEYSDRLSAIEAQAASALATQKSEVAAAIAQVNLTQSQTITALTLEVNNLKTNLTDSITATQTDLINRADQLAQNVVDITDQLAQDKAAFTQEIQDALVYLENAESVASALRTPRKINGTAFDGRSDITTNAWGATRTFKIGNKTNSINGTSNVSYTLADIGAFPDVGGTIQGDVEVTGNLSVGGTISATLVGNAGTATKLQTPRTINGVSFDGSANITLPLATTSVSGTVQLNNTLTSTSTGQALTAAQGKVLNDNKLAKTANAVSASKLQTSRTISLTGGVTGSVSFDGSANATIAATVTGLGAANGIATLDSSGQVPSTQLPSFVDDVLEYASVAAFPTTGETGKIYVETTGNTTYRWGGSGYVKITSGEVSSVAGKVGVVTLSKSDVGLANADNTADSVKSVASAAKLTTARTINGTSFNGSANITTANWGTARTLTLGNTGKSVNGSANVSWSADEILPTGANGQVLKHNGTSWVAGADNNTTYSAMSAAEATTGTATTARVITPAVLKSAITTHAPVQTTISGNAATATKLATARTINGEAFDGTKDINVSLVTNPMSADQLISSISKQNSVWDKASNPIPEDSPYSSAIKVLNIGNPSWNTQFVLPAYDNDMYMRTRTTSGGDFRAWRQFAFTDSNITGNAASATKLQTARTIGGVSFNGTANINLPGVNTVGTQSTTGNAATATKLQTARTINGVSFDGTANVTTTNWGTARNLTVGRTAKSVNGSADVAWTADEVLPTGTSGQVLKHNGTSWVASTDSNTTYSVMSAAEANAGTVTTGRVITAAVLKGAIQTHAPVQTSVTGNAGTATKLQTARTIGGVSFDGSANINLPGVNTAGNQSTSGNAASATKLATARTINGTSFNGTANITVPVNVVAIPSNADLNTYQTPGFYSCAATATAATLSNRPTAVAFSMLVEKHAGVRQTITEYTTEGYKIYVRNFYANAWGAWSRIYTTHDAPTSVSGNAATATTLQTARTIAISGAVTGTATSFNGSANIAIATTAIDGSKISTGTIPAARIPTLNQATTANAGSATKLATARTINGVSFNGTANITVADSTKLPLAGGTMTGALKVNNTTASTSATTGAITTTGGVGIGGALFTTGAITSANNITAYSDSRIKDNITLIDDALNKVNQLRGVTYNRIDIGNKDKRYVGLIAQDVQSVMPEAVNVNNDEINTLSVDYQGLVGLLVESIKELKLEIDELKEKVK